MGHGDRISALDASFLYLEQPFGILLPVVPAGCQITIRSENFAVFLKGPDKIRIKFELLIEPIRRQDKEFYALSLRIDICLV